MSAQDPGVFLLSRLKNDSAGTVSKNYRYIATARLKVHRKGMLFTAYHQNILIRTCFYKLVSHGKGIYESRTLVSHIQCSYLTHPHFTLQENAAAGKIVVRTQRRKDDEIDI